MTQAYDFWAARLERAERRRVDAFWHRFERVEGRARRALDGTAPHFEPGKIAHAALGELAGRLRPHFERTEEGWRIVLSPVAPEDRVLARAAMRSFPDLPGWSVGDARAGVSEGAALGSVAASGRGDRRCLERMSPRRAPHRLIDMEAQGTGAAEAVTAQARAVARGLLGEGITRDWMGETRVRGRPGGMLARFRPWREGCTQLAELRDRTVQLIATVAEERPVRRFAESPYAREPASRYELAPAEGSFPPAPRADGERWESRYPALAAARLARAPIASARFSRFGECFCGVQIRRSRSAPFTTEGALADLGKAVESGLMSAGLGGLTGRGHGRAHVYLDLALVGIEKSLSVIAAAIKTCGVEAPAWMIFDETGLEQLTLPLTPGTPPSPY